MNKAVLQLKSQFHISNQTKCNVTLAAAMTLMWNLFIKAIYSQVKYSCFRCFEGRPGHTLWIIPLTGSDNHQLDRKYKCVESSLRRATEADS